MNLIKPESHLDYMHTFVFSTEAGLEEAEKRVKGAGLGYVVPVVEDGPEWMLQVKGEQAAKRVCKVLRHKFKLDEPMTIISQINARKMLVGQAWGCRMVEK